MARFVSPHRNFSLGVRDGKPAHLGVDGKMVPEQTELKADFTPDWRDDEAIAVARSSFTFRGLPIFENGQHVDVIFRIGVYDSELDRLKNGWTEEDEALIVETLRNSGPNGVMYKEIIPVPTEKPWNGYDELSDADKILELALAIDADLRQVVSYERENEKRPEVLDALNAAIAASDETIVVSA